MRLEDLISSFTIAITSVAIWGHLPSRYLGSLVRRRVAMGLVLGAGALGSMLTPYQVSSGVLLDLRSPLIAVAAFVGGPLSAVIAGVPVILFRASQGGSGVWAGCMASCLAALIGVAVYRWSEARPPSALHPLALGLLVVTSLILSAALLPSTIRALVMSEMLPLMPLTFGATWLLGLSVSRDERHRRLMNRNEIYRAIIEALPDSLNAKDLDGCFIAANPATARLMGAASADDLLGRSDFDFYPNEIARQFKQQETEVLKGAVVGPIEELVRFNDGSERWLASLKTPMLDSANQILGTITHNRDITGRKRLETALGQLQADFAAAITHMADGLVLYDRNGLVRFCNQQYRNMFPDNADLLTSRCSKEHMISAAMGQAEADPTHDADCLISDHTVRLKEPGNRTVRLSDGRTVEARSRRVGEDELLITFSDVTDLRQSELKSRETNRLLVLAEEIAHVGHWRIDVAGQKLEWSDEVFRIHGLDPSLPPPRLEAAIGFYHPDDREEVTNCVSRAMDLRQNFDFTLRIVRPDGEERHVFTRGICEVDAITDQVTGLFGVFGDITDLTRAQSELADREALYRILTDTTSDVITQLNLDLTRRYVSPSCRSVLGYQPDEFVALPPFEVIHPEDFGDVRSLMERLVAGQVDDDRGTATYRIRHRAGHYIWVEAALSLVRESEHGQPESLLLSMRDVSERQRAARHLERAKTAAEKVAQLKSEFVANMSHELRTPLTVILGIHDLLDEDPSLGPSQKRQVRMARDAGRSLHGIINDILDFSKIESGQMTIEKVRFDAVDVLESCCALMHQAALSKGIDLSMECGVDPAHLVGDPVRLRQIVLNLVTNAVKFTERGRVTLRATHDDVDRLRVEVSDTGIGVADDQISLLFGRFNQADASITRRYGGTGLGLSISKRLVELMGGEIGVTSTVGEGSTFWFEIPMGVKEQPNTPAVRKASIPGQGLRVLLAEDNIVNQEVIKAMLETRGHRVTVVGNGAEAVDALAEAAPFDVVLMDLQMPVMDGLAATRSIRERERSDGRDTLPIIGLTANAMVDDVRRCFDAGMQDHVAKPIEWPDLFAALDNSSKSAMSEVTTATSESSILVREKIDDLAVTIGAERVAKLLAAFSKELKACLGELEAASETDLLRRSHKMASTSGQFGFLELSMMFAAVERDARDGLGWSRVAELRGCLERALCAAQRYAEATARPPIATQTDRVRKVV